MNQNKIPALAQFNKVNGMFIMVLDRVPDLTMLNHDFYNYAEIEIDVNAETVLGTYDNFQIINVQELPVEITEDYLNILARNKIVSEYPIERQLTVLGTVLEKLADTSGIDCEDLKVMNDFISEVKRTNRIRKEFYTSNPDYKYMSTVEADELIRQKYEGGIVEYANSTSGF